MSYSDDLSKNIFRILVLKQAKFTCKSDVFFFFGGGGGVSIPRLKMKNGKGVAQSDLEKAEEFNGQFMDVFSKNEHTQVPLLDRSAPSMDDIVVFKDGVIKLLKGLNPSKALGPD